MPSLKTYDLFISHAWRYGDDYDRIVALLDGATNFYYRNYSGPKDRPLVDPNSQVSDAVLRDAIDRKIRPVNAVLVLSGMYAAYRGWMQAEIDIARMYNKPIIGIMPWGNARTPLNVESASKTIVGWNTHSIVNAIRNFSI